MLNRRLDTTQFTTKFDYLAMESPTIGQGNITNRNRQGDLSPIADCRNSPGVDPEPTQSETSNTYSAEQDIFLFSLAISNCKLVGFLWEDCIIQNGGRDLARYHQSRRVNLDPCLTWSLIDLRSAQVYCVAIFLVSQEVSLNFHRCCG